jgi:hypothetical protein
VNHRADANLPIDFASMLRSERNAASADRESRRKRVVAKLAAQESPDLKPFATFWDNITAEDVDAIRAALAHAKEERPLQSLFEQRPHLLAQQLGGGHGRWVIPRPRLGGEHIPDFFIAEASSLGMQWVAVELESPTARMFTTSGNPSAVLTHAIRQIQDWRSWLTKNVDYATRSRADSGLGLPDIDGEVSGLILIGRRDADLGERTRSLRRQMVKDLGIAIHSYDWLLHSAEHCAARNANMALHRSTSL